jgi:hypothetical protein
MYLSIRHLFT